MPPVLLTLALAQCTPLQQAILGDDAAAVQRRVGRRLLGVMPAPDAELEHRGSGDCDDRTALMVAAEHGASWAVELLLVSGANPAATTAGDDARCLALAQGHFDVAALFPSPELPCTAQAHLFGAIRSRNPAALDREIGRAHSPAVALAALAELNTAFPEELIARLAAQLGGLDPSPAFEAAAANDDAWMATRLQAHGLRVRTWRALAHALSARRPTLIAPLLRAGAATADPHVREAVRQVFRRRDAQLLTALLAAGWRGDAETPAILWAMQFYPDSVSAVVDAGCDVDGADPTGTTPLMFAAQHGRGAWVNLLLGRGARRHP